VKSGSAAEEATQHVAGAGGPPSDDPHDTDASATQIAITIDVTTMLDAQSNQ
jgi:hypothetical protein